MVQGAEYQWGEPEQRHAIPGGLTHTQRLRTIVVFFVFPTYVLTVLSTFALLFLNGFSVIELHPELLRWMGPVVLGEAISSAGLIITYLFRRSEE